MDFLALLIATGLILAPFVYIAGAAWAAIWVARSLPECKQAAIELSAENGLPLVLMKVLLPTLVILAWPMTLYAIFIVKSKTH
jgi:hypothetical protein